MAKDLRGFFQKVADGKIQPENFGSCLLEAAAQGLASREDIARILKSENVRKAGNALKTRDMPGVAVAVLALRQ